ncbi:MULTISPECIES: hypothetical protein [Gordonia]|uniref:hypothetical protein n=1 Tax=Gordonia TaxID=2053 RepID=UPI00339B59F1
MNHPTDRRHQDEHQCHPHGLCCRLLDPHTRVPLGPYGAPGVEVAESVDGFGDRQLWIVQTAHIGAAVDHGNPKPDHENRGRLPAEIRDRIWGSALRCGRPTTAGRPCRARVAEPGTACPSHREVCR